jgi:hypothetical protein
MASRSRHGIADVHNVVVAHMPDYQIVSVVQVGKGLDNLAYEVNGELIVRFSKEPDPARRTALINHEARLLAVVASNRVSNLNTECRLQAANPAYQLPTNDRGLDHHLR